MLVVQLTWDLPPKLEHPPLVGCSLGMSSSLPMRWVTSLVPIIIGRSRAMEMASTMVIS